MSSAQAQPIRLKFEVGARTLMAIQRSLVRVPLSLEEAREGRLPALPPLAREAHGYSVTSLPEDRLQAMIYASGGMLPFVRQRYTRYWADLTGSFDTWFEGLSSNARQQLRRKARRIAQESGGELDVRAFRTPDELEGFHDIARRISLRTYQERLMGSGLPDSAEFIHAMLADAAADRVRAWLLYIGGEPAAYLYCPVEGDTVIYAHVGHDPAFNELSPGAVLQLEAMRDLFDEGRYSRFDFTEGEGQHKRQMATGGIACVDLLLLRPSLMNRLTTASLGGFNKGVALAKGAVNRAGMGKLAKKVRRG
ncbi:GNAT family N-acetyltransferase [Sphingomonas canadensis]|uniref:GNAT family N-acetyltransferase n=1 Tax=Sphingomonas canadensis TaxID=1219257 RepID=A0ABW3H4E4_9SPHN|nr:GNAT family N-acetyltransferase [Sphingomonas canadensis]MCW3835958.1 GNAT family N-acetyltransferase [Sphingomonas canadensis]